VTGKTSEGEKRRGPGRPRKHPIEGKRQNVTFRLREETREWLGRISTEAGRSLSEEIEYRLELSRLQAQEWQKERDNLMQFFRDREKARLEQFRGVVAELKSANAAELAQVVEASVKRALESELGPIMERNLKRALKASS
jgi:hypothetical protein